MLRTRKGGVAASLYLLIPRRLRYKVVGVLKYAKLVCFGSESLAAHREAYIAKYTLSMLSEAIVGG